MPCRNTFIWAILVASTWKRSTILLRRSLISEKYRQASVCELTTCRLKGVKGNGKSDCERAKHIRMFKCKKKTKGKSPIYQNFYHIYTSLKHSFKCQIAVPMYCIEKNTYLMS